MFAQLPETLKKEVLYHLKRDNFPRAKAIHDSWLKSQKSQSRSRRSNNSES